ncbi:MAG: helicase-exonuclease AddAB subunit AddA, partial [Lachnospiraceae bacterium]|nr:helicase-exonuclease AddAB subunit AddA [Lachnospiraceae bacterium]
MKWTDEQKRVIDTRAANILVAASAGSGKTAVLVARIMALLTDAGHPMNIDELLIVTFTKAAAGEMKERIAGAILDALEEDPDNEHLHRQTQLIHNAKITTIDGFCSYLVRAYGYLTDLEPGFRVAEQGELELLKADVMEELLEASYAEADEEKRRRFYALVESVATGKSEKVLEDYILKVFDAAESRPRPFVWLRRCREENRAESFQDMRDSAWYRQLHADADEVLREGLAKAETNEALAGQPDGPSAYLANAMDDVNLFEGLLREQDPDRRHELLRDMKMSRLSGKRPSPGENPDLREVFKNRRAEMKELLEELKTGVYAAPAEKLFIFMQKNAPIMDTLLDVAGEFMVRFAKKKRDKKIVDFADLEHFALEILRGRDDAPGRTAAAKELAAHFREVMCDEYQDSNDLQEEILTAVSRIEDGEDNYFCVGDVKQSIYAFRHARPDLFMQKYREYRKFGEAERSAHGLSGIRIDLARNFRSRDEVLRSANLLFEQFMVSGVGGVDYDEDAMLITGAAYPDAGGRCVTEILPIISGEEDSEGNTVLDDTGSRACREVEARTIADRISRIVGKETVYDPKTGKSRPATYRDVVILLRTMTGWSDIFTEVLESRGIPAFSSSGTGYFTALEVVTVLNYLRILDNPEQDLAFAAVLKSPITGLSAEEIAGIRLVFGSPSLVREAGWKSLHACARAAEAGEGTSLITEETRGRLNEFFAFYDRVRATVPYTPVHELVYTVLEGTGYLAYAGSLPGGAQRAANLKMLEEKAIAYESTSYAGLSSFVRYIESLSKYEVDFGTASVASENADVVRIISIHKSKGLEYPIVFVSGLGKSFNRQDINASLLVDERMGIASDYVDYVGRTRTPTIKKEAIKKKMQKEFLGEELRVLYVALTRAKEKLILTGTV